MKALNLEALRVALLATLVVGLVGFGSLASARGGGRGGGGGGHGDGFSGGSMRDSGSHDSEGSQSHEGDVTTGTTKNGDSYAEGPRGGEVGVAPDGATAARAPDGATAVRAPDGDTVVRGPDGGVAVGNTGHGEVYGDDYHGAGWGGYYGDDYVGGAVAVGALTGLAVGSMVESLPDSANLVVVGNQNYYLDNDVYYQSCYDGSMTSYCVVDDPN